MTFYMTELVCFKTYDIRGVLDEQLNEDVVYRIARAFAIILKTRKVVVGHDIRFSSESLMQSVIMGLMHEGVQVLNLGLCGTEEMYFATNYYDADGGIEITASHNPINYNGMKLVGEGARPLNVKKEFMAIKRVAETNLFSKNHDGGQKFIGELAREQYVKKILSFVDYRKLKPIKILVNHGNGVAGQTFEEIEKELKTRDVAIKFIHLHKKPDGNFPNGIPNPMLPANRVATSQAVFENEVDIGLAFDGDFDRCFFFDEQGRFIEGEYMVALLASIFFKRKAGSTVAHDPRSVWNLQDVALRLNGNLAESRTGHAFMKQTMREHDAIYGGEMSAHHYFKDFFYSDSGMVPWLLVCELLSETNLKMSDLVQQFRSDFPSSGEINFEIKNVSKVIEAIKSHYNHLKLSENNLDGISYEFSDWRFNLRSSNTEPLVRLNVETSKTREYLDSKVQEVTEILEKSDI